MVLINVWRPKKGHVGHASLETDAFYISFWPEKGKNILEKELKDLELEVRLLF